MQAVTRSTSGMSAPQRRNASSLQAACCSGVYASLAAGHIETDSAVASIKPNWTADMIPPKPLICELWVTDRELASTATIRRCGKPQHLAYRLLTEAEFEYAAAHAPRLVVIQASGSATTKRTCADTATERTRRRRGSDGGEGQRPRSQEHHAMMVIPIRRLQAASRPTVLA
jgi:hypothetical protein